MLKISKIILTTLILFNCHTSSADQNTIPSFTAKYSVSKSGISLGEMVSTFKTDLNNNYTYSSITQPKGIARWFSSETVTEISSGVYSDEKISSHQYIYSRAGGKKEQHTKIDFDYKNMVAVDITNNETTRISIGEKTTDRQIVQIILMTDMLKNKNNLSYEVINKQELKPYNFKMAEAEKIKTNLGEFNTIKVIRKREGSSRETTLWLAEKLHYIPIRIKQTKDGSTKFEMNIIKLDGIDIPHKTLPTDDKPSSTSDKPLSI